MMKMKRGHLYDIYVCHVILTETTGAVILMREHNRTIGPYKDILVCTGGDMMKDHKERPVIKHPCPVQTRRGMMFSSDHVYVLPMDHSI